MGGGVGWGWGELRHNAVGHPRPGRPSWLIGLLVKVSPVRLCKQYDFCALITSTYVLLAQDPEES